MFDMETQKKEIRKQLISSAIIYRNELAGKSFLYVYGEQYFEVLFRTNSFKHLTGVASSLAAEDFYTKAKEAELEITQFGFSADQPYRTAKKKIVCMHLLPRLTSELVCVLKDLHTATFTYKIGVTNLEFTIGLTDNLDDTGNKIDDRLVPRTLRIKDKAIESSKDSFFVDYIFSKGAADTKYSHLCYASPDAQIPEIIKPMLSEDLK